MSGGVGADRKRGRKVTAPARYPIDSMGDLERQAGMIADSRIDHGA